MIKLVNSDRYDARCDILVIPCNDKGDLIDTDAGDFKQKGIANYGYKLDAGNIAVLPSTLKDVGNIMYASYFDTTIRGFDIFIAKEVISNIRDYCIYKNIKSINIPIVYGRKLSLIDAYKIISTSFSRDSILVNIYILSIEAFRKLKMEEADSAKPNSKEELADINAEQHKNNQSINISNMKNEITRNVAAWAEKKYQIFVSSTYNDLVEERKEATQALLECGCIPTGMELFPAASKRQWEIIKSVIDDCDAYILILAGRYGSVGKDDKGRQIGYTEMEFNYALETNKPIIAFLHSDFGSIEAKKVEASEDGRKRLSDFYDKVKDGRLIKYWTNKDNLKAAIFQSVTNLKRDTPMVGWVRDTTTATFGNKISVDVGDKIGGNELAEYRHRLSVYESTIQNQKSEIDELKRQLDDSSSQLTSLKKGLINTKSELASKRYEMENVKKSFGLLLQQLREWASTNEVNF